MFIAILSCGHLNRKKNSFKSHELLTSPVPTFECSSFIYNYKTSGIYARISDFSLVSQLLQRTLLLTSLSVHLESSKTLLFHMIKILPLLF